MSLKPQTLVFIGRSGCGKGTQVDLIKEYLTKEDPEGSIFHVETGANFRKFIENGTYTGNMSKKIMDAGGLQPVFLAIYMWAEYMTENFNGEKHIIFDGTPRKKRESMVLDTALDFFEREKPVIVNLDVSREWSMERLLDRGRFDDDEKEINKRLDWFDTDVAPAIEWFKGRDDYRLVDINGEQTIEEVHKEILDKAVDVG